jgi:hypothetical protein
MQPPSTPVWLVRLLKNYLEGIKTNRSGTKFLYGLKSVKIKKNET